MRTIGQCKPGRALPSSEETARVGVEDECYGAEGQIMLLASLHGVCGAVSMSWSWTHQDSWLVLYSILFWGEVGYGSGSSSHAWCRAVRLLALALPLPTCFRSHVATHWGKGEGCIPAGSPLAGYVIGDQLVGPKGLSWPGHGICNLDPFLIFIPVLPCSISLRDTPYILLNTI